MKKATAANPATPLATLPFSATSGPTVCLVESSRYDANNNYLGRECDDNRDLSTLRSPWSEDAGARQPAIAYSPTGDEIMVSVPISTVTSHALGAWDTCTWGGDVPPLSQQCRRVTVQQAITGTTVYGIKVAGGSVRTIWTHGGGRIYWLGIAETAQQLVTTTGTYNWAFGFFSSQPDLYIDFRNRGACSFNFLDGTGQATEPAIPVGPDCGSQVGTVAPIRWAGN